MAHTIHEPTLRDLLRVLTRHKKKAIAFGATVILLTAAVLVVLPRKFRSDAKLFVRLGRESVALDPTAATGQTLQVRTDREMEVNSILLMLKTHSVMEKVVDAVGPNVVLTPPPNIPFVEKLAESYKTIRTSLNQVVGKSGLPPADEDLRQLAVTHLMETVEVSAPKLSTVIDLSCTAHTPENARQIVDTIVDIYLGEHARLNRTSGSEEFFREQTDKIAIQLCEKQNELRDLKNELGVESIAGHRTLLSEKKSSIEQQRLTTTGQLAASMAKIKALTDSVDFMDKEVVANRVSGRPNAATDGIRQKLYDLEIREGELSARYSKDHPFVVAVRQQLTQLRKAFDAEKDSRSELTYALNDNRQQLELELMVEQARLAGLEATTNALHQQHDELLAELRNVNTFAITIEDLERQAELLENDYRAHAQNLELARIDNELRSNRITNVNIVQSATLPEDPTGPRRLLIVAIALMAALLGGAVLALVAECLNERVATPREAEDLTSLPVLISIPRSRRQCVQA